MNIRQETLCDYNALPHSLFCGRCGGELYHGDLIILWDGNICADCMRDKLLFLSDVELARLMGFEYLFIK